LSKVHGLIVTNKNIKIQLLAYQNNIARVVNYCPDIMVLFDFFISCRLTDSIAD
jgi:hypothetical protein